MKPEGQVLTSNLPESIQRVALWRRETQLSSSFSCCRYGRKTHLRTVLLILSELLNDSQECKILIFSPLKTLLTTTWSANKGTCNRQTGTCDCYPGYDGAACQRASCPGDPDSCSGHGVCKSIRQLASADYGNIYELWDRDTTMGCECDAGFFGPDCSQRQCKSEIDPLYYDDTSTVKTAVFDFAVVSTDQTGFVNSMEDSDTGKWAIVFYDCFGQKWQTKPLLAGASCDDVLDALNGLPNDVIHTTHVENHVYSHDQNRQESLDPWR